MDAQAMEARIDRLEQAILARFDQISAELGGLRGLSAEIAALRASLMDFRVEMIQHFEMLETRVDMMNLTVKSLDARTSGLTELERPAA